MWSSLILILLAFMSPAVAATTICVEYRTDYVDTHPLLDYFSDNSVKPAWGILIYVTEVGGAPQSAWADWSGPDQGCATFHLDPLKTYKVTAGTRARIRDNIINVHNANGEYVWSTDSTFSGWRSALTLRLPVADEWNVAAAMGWAMARRHGGLTDVNIVAYLDACASGDACYSSLLSRVYITPFRSSQMFIIVHEMGHALQHAIDDVMPQAPYNADSGSCPGSLTDPDASHSFNTREYTSAAFVEGFAHFYAALAFNNNSENNDCWWVYPGVDWNHNSVFDVFEGQPFSCAVGDPTGPIPDFNYYDTYCAGSGSTDNAHGNEYDWLRFFWHLTSRQDPNGTILSFTDVVTSIDEADTWLWAATGNGPTQYWPYQKLEGGAYSVGTPVGAAWSYWGGLHGLDR